MKRRLIFFMASLILPLLGYAQYTPWYYWTLLPQEQMQLIIGEASGETAYNTIMETSGYTRNRRPEEHNTTFKEAAYIYQELKWYGVPEANINRIPVAQPTWDGVRGDLWEISPNKSKIASYQDNVFQLASGSNNTDIEAELVWVGSGTAAEVAAANVKGKIAVGHGSVSTIHSNAVAAGAVGALGISTSRNYFDPLQLPTGSVGNVRVPGSTETIPAKFGFQMNIREGQYLISRLERGEKIMAHALVEAGMERNEFQNVEAYIPGTDPNATAVIFSAHIFEGLTKQGANDNMSGGAAILEVARVLNTLINDGSLPRPKRGIRFLWGPEFSGTRPWVETNLQKIKNTYCNINLDMVGEWLTLNDGYFCLMRTTMGNPHYVNDVMENYFRFVGEGNRERVQNRSGVYKVPHRVVAPFGADEPFHYSIETNYGSSDHEVFNAVGVQIPGVMMIVWPDLWYHTSGDVISKSDPTQLKRAVVIAAASAYTIANADDNTAVKIAGETASNATRRLGHQMVIAMEMINNSDAMSLTGNYRRAVSLMEAHIAAEKATLETVYELASKKEALSPQIEGMKKSVEEIGKAQIGALATHMSAKARLLGVAPVTIVLTDPEKKAEKMIPSIAPSAVKMGASGLATRMSAVPAESLAKYPMKGRPNTTELVRLINGKHSVLLIKKMLDAQVDGGNADLQDIINYVEQLRLAGVVVI